MTDRKSTRLNSSHDISPLSLHDVLSSSVKRIGRDRFVRNVLIAIGNSGDPVLADEARRLLNDRSEEHTSELQSRYIPPFPTRRPVVLAQTHRPRPLWPQCADRDRQLGRSGAR